MAKPPLVAKRSLEQPPTRTSHFKQSLSLKPKPAKGSGQSGKRLSSAIVDLRRRVAVTNRNWRGVARRIKTINKNNVKLGRQSAAKERPVPTVTPDLRQKLIGRANESDEDILTVNEEVDFSDVESPSAHRGRLLRQSTLKPQVEAETAIAQPDPIPRGAVDSVKRIVRIVRNSPPVVDPPPKKFVSVGVQVGTPSRQLYKPHLATEKPAFVEPPLKGYWTHHVNLPYPPANQQPAPSYAPPQSYAQQFVPYQPQQPQYVPVEPQYATFGQPPPPQQVYYSAPVVQQSVNQGPYQPGPGYTRKQRRNFSKHQRYIERKSNQ